MVVYGLYGNAYSHFELGSSRHMHESGERGHLSGVSIAKFAAVCR